MQKWLRQNLTISIIFTLISSIAIGAAFSAVINSDVQKLNKEVFGNYSDQSLSVKFGKLETKVDDAISLLQKIDNKVRP